MSANENVLGVGFKIKIIEIEFEATSLSFSTNISN